MNSSLKLSFTNIRGLLLNFVGCESFLESNSPDILALCETNLDDSIYSGSSTVRIYLPLIPKDSSTHMHGLAVYVKEGLPYAGNLFLETSGDSYLCFRLALLHTLSYFFFLYRSPSLPLCWVFDSISSNIDGALTIKPSANDFVFGYLTSIIRTGLPILMELVDLVNSVIISNDLLRCLPFLLVSQTLVLKVLLFWIYLFLLTLLLSQFLHWRLSSKFRTGYPVSLHSLWLFLGWLGRPWWSFERYSMAEYY